MNTKKKVIENSFFYVFSSLLMKAIGFFLLPVYTLFLVPEDYGTINLINAFIEVAIFIVSFSLFSAAIRFYTDYKNDREKLKRFYGTISIFIFFSGITIVTLGLIFKNLLISIFFKNIPFYPIVQIGLLTLIFFTLHALHQYILQGMQQGKKLTIINLSVFGFQISFNLYFIIVLKMGALGILISTFIINVGYFIYMIFDLKKNDLITFCVDKKLLYEALKYSIPIMPHDLSTHVASFASRVFINKSGTIALVGLYSVASQIGSIIDSIQTSVNQAFAPWFYDSMHNGSDEQNREIVNLSKFMLFVYSLIYMSIGLFSQEVIFLMTTEKYVRAWAVIPIFVAAYSIKSIYYFYVNILLYYKEASKKIFLSTVTSSLADVILASLLVPVWGMYGAAAAFLLAKIIVVVIVVIISKRYNSVGYKIGEMLKIIIPSLLFLSIGLFFSYTKYMTVLSWHNLLFKVIILLAYILFAYFTNKKIIDRNIKSGRILEILKRKRKSKAENS